MKVGLPCMKLSLSPSSQRHNGKKASTCSVIGLERDERYPAGQR